MVDAGVRVSASPTILFFGFVIRRLRSVILRGLPCGGGASGGLGGVRGGVLVLNYVELGTPRIGVLIRTHCPETSHRLPLFVRAIRF